MQCAQICGTRSWMGLGGRFKRISSSTRCLQLTLVVRGTVRYSIVLVSQGIWDDSQRSSGILVAHYFRYQIVGWRIGDVGQRSSGIVTAGYLGYCIMGRLWYVTASIIAADLI